MMKVVAGKPVAFRVGEFRELYCCDCGLCHLVVVDSVGKQTATLKFYRDDWATAQERKRRKKCEK